MLVLHWDPGGSVRALQEAPAKLLMPITGPSGERAPMLHARLSVSQRDDVLTMIRQHQSLFGEVHGSRPARVEPMRIVTGMAPPVHIRGRRLSPGERDAILKELQVLRQAQLVEPSTSAWVSPVLIVPKKDGAKRFCIDYRKLNSVTMRDRYPIPLIDDVIDRLHNMQYFSKMDLRSGFWQVPLDARDAHKSAFTTPVGLFQWRVMPMGLANSPSVFQRAMDQVLSDLCPLGVAVYIDDVVIFTVSWSTHIQLLTRVCERLLGSRWRLKLSKCEFGSDRMDYLGYTISTRGLHPSADKVQAVQDFPVPDCWDRVASFLGLVGYYRRFVRGFASIAEPLYALGKKDAAWQWGAAQERSFRTLQGILLAEPILRFPDFVEPFIIQTDASYSGMGAVLSQLDKQDGQDYAVAYASRTLRGAERHYSATDLEGAAVVWAVKLFRRMFTDEGLN